MPDEEYKDEGTKAPSSAAADTDSAQASQDTTQDNTSQPSAGPRSAAAQSSFIVQLGPRGLFLFDYYESCGAGQDLVSEAAALSNAEMFLAQAEEAAPSNGQGPSSASQKKDD